MKDPLRHAQGEYYTPRWLAELWLDEAGYDGAPGRRLLDPACGPGVFLEAAIARARRWGRENGEPSTHTGRRILAEIHGLERNATSVAVARAAYLAAMGECAAGLHPEDLPIRTTDALLNPPQGDPYDFVVGNPPWVRWDYLPEDYRQATMPLWRRYGLFSLRGFASLSGGGKKDLCMLFTCAAADCFLRTGGMLAFLVSEEVFKSKGAGEGFRRFRLGSGGTALGVVAAHDFTRLRPFAGVTNKAAGIVLVKGQPTTYPVPYYRWSRGASGKPVKEMLHAEPVSGPAGPWRTYIPGVPSLPLSRANAYQAVLGANANPYGVFWLEVLRALPGGLVEVRNLPELGKSHIQPVRAAIEADLVYPALRGADIRRWSARPGVHVLLVQDPATRAPVPEPELRSRWPRAWEYLEPFRRTLLARALYRRYHQRAGRPFYSQFNIGPALLRPYKVVWKRLANDLCSAVLSTWESSLGCKSAMPLETVCFIGVEQQDEAHYLCALLNSNPARDFVKSFSAAGRGFGTPSAIARLPIPRFDAADPTHALLARCSRLSHLAPDHAPSVDEPAERVLRAGA
ncbi:MAG: N-6 DNA methylase [Bryobacteraceae bacterium]